MLLAYWKLNELTGSSAYDQSGHRHHASYGFGFTKGLRPILISPGRSVLSDGTDQINIPRIRVGTQLSFDCWINPQSLLSFDLLKSDDFRVGVRSGQWYVWVQGVESSHDANIVTDSVQYVCVTVNFLAGQIRIYLDGSLDLDTTLDKISLETRNGAIARGLAGRIEEVTLMRNVLPEAKIKQRFAIGTTLGDYESLVLSSNPLAYWRMDGGSSAQEDITGSGVDLVLNGSILQQPPALQHGDGFSITNGYGVANVGFRALEMWIKPTGSGYVFSAPSTNASDAIVGYQSDYTAPYDKDDGIITSLSGYVYGYQATYSPSPQDSGGTVYATTDTVSSHVKATYVNGELGSVSAIEQNEWNHVVFVLHAPSAAGLYLLADQSGANVLPASVDEVAVYHKEPNQRFIKRRFAAGYYGVFGLRTKNILCGSIREQLFDLYSLDWEAMSV